MLFLESVQGSVKTGVNTGIRDRDIVLFWNGGTGCREVKKKIRDCRRHVRFLNNPNTSLACFSLLLDPDFFLGSSGGRALIASSKSWIVLRDVSLMDQVQAMTYRTEVHDYGICTE